MIHYGHQDISDEDIDAVVDVLKSDFLTQGEMVPRFEEALCQYTGVDYAIAVNSGTSALHIACLALGVAKGDTVWTTPITFVASANCALYCGADVDFIDIDPASRNIDVDLLADKLSAAKKANVLPKVIVVVHMAGIPCDMQKIKQLADEYNFKVIEDASHALGARYRDLPIGNTHYSDIAVFSFHPVKIITSGEGGMALTNSPSLANSMRKLRSHGITSDPAEMHYRATGVWYYQQIGLGFNYRLSDIHAALGLSQVKRVDEFVERRNVLSDRYDEFLKDAPLRLPVRNENDRASMHLYVVQLELNAIALTQKDVLERLREAGVGVNLHYIPVYLQPYYMNMGFREGYCPQAEKYFSEAVTIPLYPALTDQQQEQVAGLLLDILQR